MQVFHYSCLPGINAHSLCVRAHCICLTIVITHSLLLCECVFVTEKTLVRPDKAATRHGCCLCVFQMYSEAIHYIHNNGSESLLHDLSSFSVSLLHKHMQYFSLHFLSFLFTLSASFCGLQFSISLPAYLV